MGKKNFVLDTNVLLHDHKCIFNFEENDIFIPIVVLEELDKFKKGNEEINYNAREFARQLDKYTDKDFFENGAQLGPDLGRLSIIVNSSLNKRVKEAFREDKPDHRILSAAIEGAEQHKIQNQRTHKDHAPTDERNQVFCGKIPPSPDAGNGLCNVPGTPVVADAPAIGKGSQKGQHYMQVGTCTNGRLGTQPFMENTGIYVNILLVQPEPGKHICNHDQCSSDSGKQQGLAAYHTLPFKYKYSLHSTPHFKFRSTVVPSVTGYDVSNCTCFSAVSLSDAISDQ